MITTIPFGGFYESIHSGTIDQAEEMLFQNDRGDANGGLSERFFRICNYSCVFQNYAKDYAANFAHLYEIDLKFESLSSPREYNFTTDRIFCTISRKEVRRLRREVDPEALAKVAKRSFTSYDGFHSFYSPDVASWGSVDTWDHNLVGVLISAFVGEINEWDLIEDMNCNGDLDNWLCSSVAEKDAPELARLFRVSDYLRHREERNRTWYFESQGQNLLALNKA